jgi:integrase/recombinase XerD
MKVRELLSQSIQLGYKKAISFSQIIDCTMLNKPWDWIPIVKPPVVQPLQDVLSLPEVVAIISHTRKLRYQTYYWVTYSLGLRLSESLNLTIADIDSHLMRVHLRFTKG